MSILLFVIGAITLVLGALTIGFGIPINEFSFGNTLIMAGTTAAVGGLIVIGLGAVVSHLQRLADVIAMRAPLRPNRPPDMPEAGRAPAASRVPFPPKPKPEAEPGEVPLVEPPLTALAPAAMPIDELPVRSETPTLRNPDTPLAEGPKEAPPVLPSFAAFPSAGAEFGEPVVSAGRPSSNFNGSGAGEPAPEPPLPPWLSAAAPPPPEPPRAPEEANFEAMWPATEGRSVNRPVTKEDQSVAAGSAAAQVQSEVAAPVAERRTVAILKSGVVDGMGYTLYVDGSIEAELPQGTLRFASINDLREHLEKTS